MPIYSTYRCSNCKSLFYVQTWNSNGHMSPIRKKSKRSDGKDVTFSTQRPSALISCPNCEDPFWLHDTVPESQIEIDPLKTKAALKEFINNLDTDANGDQKNVALSWKQLPEQLHDTPAYRPLTYRACKKYLSTLESDPARRLTYLKKAWHLLNDIKENNQSYTMSPDDIGLLNSLLDQLQGNEEVKSQPQVAEHDIELLEELIADAYGGAKEKWFLIQAELYRELSRFDEAAAVLDRDFDFENGAEAEQLMLAIEAKKCELFYFELNNTDGLSYAWRMRRFKPEIPADDEHDSEINPPSFKISNRDWWLKVLGMLQHNWALVEEDSNGATTVYFFHDGGMTLGSSGYRLSEIRSRCAVVDSLNFSNREDAVQALERNSFFRLAERPGPWMDDYPKGHFYDARATEEGIYSKGGYWILALADYK